MTNFHNNCALPDTSMTLSAYVLQTFLLMKSILANAIFSIFKMATLIFKMAVKLLQIDNYIRYKSYNLTINLKMSVF